MSLYDIVEREPIVCPHCGDCIIEEFKTYDLARLHYSYTEEEIIPLYYMLHKLDPKTDNGPCYGGYCSSVEQRDGKIEVHGCKGTVWFSWEGGKWVQSFEPWPGDDLNL